MFKFASPVLALSLSIGMAAGPALAHTHAPLPPAPPGTAPNTPQPPVSDVKCPPMGYCNDDETVQLLPDGRTFVTPTSTFTNVHIYVVDDQGRSRADQEVRFVLRNDVTRETVWTYTGKTDKAGHIDAYHGTGGIDLKPDPQTTYRWVVYALDSDLMTIAFPGKAPAVPDPLVPDPTPPRPLPEECKTEWHCTLDGTLMARTDPRGQYTPAGVVGNVEAVVYELNGKPAANELVTFSLLDVDTLKVLHQETRTTNAEGKADLYQGRGRLDIDIPKGKKLRWMIEAYDAVVHTPNFSPAEVSQTPPVVPGPVAPTPAPTTSPNATTEPTPGSTASPDTTNSVRLAGSNRIETAIAINRELVKNKPKRVFIASADNPADAVAAAPLAAAEHAPIYVTWKDDIDPNLANELATVIGPETHVTVLGGEAAISAKVAKALGGTATRQDRLAGANRADTATKVADQLVTEHKREHVMIADGQRWEAPIVAAPPAIATKQAILLSNGDQAAPETKAWLTAHKVELTTTIGKASKAHPNAGRAIGETDGPALSLAVANAFYTKPTRIGFATGRTPVDAMVAGIYLNDGPILLVERELSQHQRDWVKANPTTSHIIFGGNEAIESL